MKWYDDDIDAIFVALSQARTLVDACRVYEANTGKRLDATSVTHAFRARGWQAASYYLGDVGRIAKAWPRFLEVSGVDLRPGGSLGHPDSVGDAGADVWVASSSAPRHVVDDRGGKRPSDNPRVNPALHVPQAPKGYHLRGVSTLLDGEGKPVQQWVKTTQDKEAENLDRLLEALKELPANYSQAHEPVKVPERVDDDMLVVIPIGDPHLGMLSWAEETGANYDLKIARGLHTRAIRSLVAMSPPAKNALICSLGDFFHVSNDLARTEKSGNPLDTDSRFSKALGVGIEMFAEMIDAALSKFQHVRVVCEIGNHDIQASMMLALATARFYSRDERVSVDTSPSKFHYYRFGKCLFGTTHGDGAKADKLPLIMARDRARDWGETVYRKWLVGHIHQDKVLCYPGCRVEHYRTLAAGDAWAHGEGYRSDRGMGAEYYHREHGFVGNGYVPLSLLEAA